MAKEESTPGLLSKVVKFVRNPTTNWSDLEHREAERESTYTKQALKEMIERKRRNDFVRKREFDMLRKLRKRETVTDGQDGNARPSFFQSSLPSKPDDRAMTLKKIDEIEAQMSMQWWKTKHGAGSSLPPSSLNFPISEISSSGPQSGAPPKAPPPPEPTRNISYLTTAPASMLAATESMGLEAEAAKLVPPAVNTPPVLPHSAQRTPARPTVAPSPPATRTPLAQPPVTAKNNVALGGLSASYDGGTTGFSSSKLFAMEIEEIQHDPELEEAAIRFANGDEAGAEAALLEALGPRGTRAQHEETWYTLFDLYRATGQHDRFESHAIDFAGRFHRSAPMWFSLPDLVNQLTHAAAPIAAIAGRTADWKCPPQFGVQTLAALNASIAKSPMPWHLDWSRLQKIEPAALAPLMRLFGSWAAQPVQLRFIGVENLESLLQKLTPSGDAQTPQDAWRLRLEALRIMHRPDEFELAALDFCVTYEVSPPAWENGRCQFKALDADGVQRASNTIIGEASMDSALSSLGGLHESEIGNSAHMAHTASLELAGHIQGDASAALEKIESRTLGADVMVISCTKLIRVDFSAAGTLLNWVTARHMEGRTVQFIQVHRLVAAFFQVIGISETAKVVTRTD